MEFTRTLPRWLVHRAAIAEVLLTDAQRREDDSYHLAAQLPRAHAFYGDTLGPRTSYDPMLLLEVARQGIFVLGHRFFGVPEGYQFILRTVEFDVLDPTALAPPKDVPTHVVVGCQIERRLRGRTGVTGLVVRYTMVIDDREAMAVRINYSWMPPEQWTAMRATRRSTLGLPATPSAPWQEPRIDARLVDRRDPDNAVISPPRSVEDGGRAATLVVDTSHATMFDHRLDHVPGMLELEAFRQLALTAAVDSGVLPTPTALLVGLSARFRSLAELDLSAECRTGPVRPGEEIHCSMHQAGTVVAEARVRLADRSRPDLAEACSPLFARA